MRNHVNNGFKEKENADFQYLTLTCRRDIEMLRISLLSLEKSATSLPRLMVVHDDSIGELEVRSSLSFWPGKIAVIDRKTISDWHSKRGNVQVAGFCNAHVLGLKFAACAMQSTLERVLFVDSDVLWFNDVNEVIARHCDLPIYASGDAVRSYDEELLALGERELARELTFPPYVNSGTVVYNRPLLEIADFRAMLTFMTERRPPSYFSEQTMIAMATKLVGAVMASEVIHISLQTDQSRRGSFHQQVWHARHYVKPVRQQFWIDAAVLFNSRLAQRIARHMPPPI